MIPESRFYREVRQFAATAKVWQAAIRYTSLPDEKFDLTLVSQRVYGSRDEYLAVMAAAGLDRLDQPLEEQLLVLPTPELLERIKRQTGYRSAAPVSVR